MIILISLESNKLIIILFSNIFNNKDHYSNNILI